MVGTALKALGVIVLVGGVLGTIGGIGLMIFGQQLMSDSDDGVLLANEEQREAGDEAGAAGATLTGYSLFVAGLGLALLVVGIVVGGREKQGQLQRQVLVIAGSGPPVVQTQQRPPMS